MHLTVDFDVPAHVEKVFDLLADPRQMVLWSSNVQAVERKHDTTSEVGVGDTFIIHGGAHRVRVRTEYTVRSFDRPRVFSGETVAGPLRYAENYVFESTEAGTRVHVTNDVKPASVLAWLMWPLVRIGFRSHRRHDYERFVSFAPTAAQVA